jgi:ferredoxin
VGSINKIMAEQSKRLPRNIAGAFYVDETCIDCDICREAAPGVFRRDNEMGLSYVWRQPATADEIVLAEDVLRCCPADAIGTEENQDRL